MGARALALALKEPGAAPAQAAGARRARGARLVRPGPGRTPRMRVVVATDKFKGSLTAAEVARVAGPRAAPRRSPTSRWSGCRSRTAATEPWTPSCPRGSSGTRSRCPGRAASRCRRRTPAAATSRSSSWPTPPGWAGSAAGLAPLSASTHGTGEAIRAAVEAGCREVVVGLGGSASTDGGAGLVTALGARILDARGRPVPAGGAGLLEAASPRPRVAARPARRRRPDAGLRRRQPAARARRARPRSTARRRARPPTDVAVARTRR